MINFTVGPVQSEESVRAMGAEQVPYFRTPEFSSVMKENEKFILEFANAPANSRAVFITGSGTASMEATVINVFNCEDNVLVVNGGSFGERFVELLKLHDIKHTEIKLDAGKTLTSDILSQYENQPYSAFLVNLHETSTGVLYDIDLIKSFCLRNRLLLVVDAISCFLADEINMEKQFIDVLITGSQKALACPPGISVIALSPRAIERVNSNTSKCMYLDLKSALQNGERGQTPFTPAVGILNQINVRLNNIAKKGGVNTETKKVKELALYFRERIKHLPFKQFAATPSNAVTALEVTNGISAYTIFTVLKDEYDIWVCPNGGALKDRVFRVGHIGYLNFSDYDKLIHALNDMVKRGIIN